MRLESIDEKRKLLIAQLSNMTSILPISYPSEAQKSIHLISPTFSHLSRLHNHLNTFTSLNVASRVSRDRLPIAVRSQHRQYASPLIVCSRTPTLGRGRYAYRSIDLQDIRLCQETLEHHLQWDHILNRQFPYQTLSVGSNHHSN